MSATNQFRFLLEELRVFQRNLNKDNNARRKDVKVVRRKFKKLDKLQKEFVDVRASFNSKQHELSVINEAKVLIDSINKYFGAIRGILETRLGDISTEQTESLVHTENSDLSDSESGCSGDEVKMGESFDLKTAGSLLPVMNDQEKITKQLIDAIELYDALLDADGKQLLTKYILKTRISQSAKIRLKNTYDSNTELVTDLKKHFLTRKSASTLSVQLNNARQGGKSIDDFGKTVEELLVDLIISQAEGNDDAVGILSKTNEKIAINAFANGLQNNELRTIIKARNYSNLRDAIGGAKDEELTGKCFSQVFHMRGRKNFTRGFSNNVKSQSRFASNNYPNQNNNQNRGGRNYNTRQFSNNTRGQGNNRGRFNYNRGNFSNNFRNNDNSNFRNHNQRTYYMGNAGNVEQHSSGTGNTNSFQSGSTDTFFRGPTYARN